jgi:hypothetical protein
MTNGIDPFWESVRKAHDQVNSHPHTKATVGRDDKVAHIYYDVTVDAIVIVVSLAKEAGRLPTNTELTEGAA